VEERDELDLDLEISEFDAAIKKTKTNTSPGIDGISNRFIKKFWHIFRVPLFNYSVYCLNRGSLTENFRIAKVRLIPKKMTQKNFKLAANKFVKLLLQNHIKGPDVKNTKSYRQRNTGRTNGVL
jgi:hypothetical protein